MRTVITGGAGFIGSHLTDYLLAQATTSPCSTTSPPARSANLDRAPRNRRLTVVRRVGTGPGSGRHGLVTGCDRVFHLAARSVSAASSRTPWRACGSTCTAPRTSWRPRWRPARSMVLTSTTETYGMNTADAWTRMPTASWAPRWSRRWNYAAAKSLDESFAHAYWREHGLKVAIARLFNTVGRARPAATAWWCPTWSARPCARAADRVRRRASRPAASLTSATSAPPWSTLIEKPERSARR